MFLIIEQATLPLCILAMARVWRAMGSHPTRTRDEVAAAAMIFGGMLLFDVVLAYARFVSPHPFWMWQESIDMARAARALPTVLLVAMLFPWFTAGRRWWALRVTALVAAGCVAGAWWVAP